MKKGEPIIKIKHPSRNVTLLLLIEFESRRGEGFFSYKFGIHNPDSENPEQSFNLDASDEELYDYLKVVFAPNIDILVRQFLVRKRIETCLPAGIWIEDPSCYI